MLTVTQALTRLVEESGEDALLLVHPKDGMAVVVRYDDDKTRLAFVREDSDFHEEGDALALGLIRKAVRHQQDEARRRVEGRRMVRLQLIVNEIDRTLEGDEPEGE